MAITRLSGGTTPPNGSDPRTFPAIWNDAVDDIEALELPITADRIADGAVTAPKLAKTAGAVMVFDDASARTTAIPTPVEGMVTYLKDTDRVDKFDGTNFVNVDTGGLIAVKSVLKTDPFSASVTAGANVAVTDLSITHAVADASNKLIISAFFGMAGHGEQNAKIGIAVHDGTGLIGIADSAGSRPLVAAGGRINVGVGGVNVTSSPGMTFVHTPGAGSKTYTVRAINMAGGTFTLTVNRTTGDTNTAEFGRGVSSLVIQEVAV